MPPGATTPSGFAAPAHLIAGEVAGEIADLLAGGPGGPVEVPGDGFAARLLRAALGSRATAARVARPAAVVDTSGRPDRLRDALDRLVDGGTLVLASADPPADLDLSVYHTIHLRSLAVVAVPCPGRVT